MGTRPWEVPDRDERCLAFTLLDEWIAISEHQICLYEGQRVAQDRAEADGCRTLLTEGKRVMRIPFEIVGCSWPRPVEVVDGRWVSEPEWDAPLMPTRPPLEDVRRKTVLDHRLAVVFQEGDKAPPRNNRGGDVPV